MDIYQDPMLNVRDAARYLVIPPTTLHAWRRDEAIHSVTPGGRGWPTLPFAAVVEAFVLRQLREAGFTRRRIAEAAAGIRREFDDDYALARPGIGFEDHVEIFFRVDADIYRAKDRQQIITETVRTFRECIQWSGNDPQRLKLARFGNVYLDPRFGWGRPIAEPSRVAAQTIMDMWYAGESVERIAYEYDMPTDAVNDLVRAWGQASEAYIEAA